MTAQRKPKALIAWSSGKDSAWALHELRKDGNYDIAGALTTVTDDFGRVSMHGVREELLRAQLDAAQLSSTIVRIPFPCPNEIYEQRMRDALAQAKSDGVTHVIFGDLFLADRPLGVLAGAFGVGFSLAGVGLRHEGKILCFLCGGFGFLLVLHRQVPLGHRHI